MEGFLATGVVPTGELTFNPRGGVGDTYTSVEALVQAGYTAVLPSLLVEAFGDGADAQFLALVQASKPVEPWNGTVTSFPGGDSVGAY